MSTIRYSIQDLRNAYKSRNSWWGYFILHPVAIRCLWFFANFTSVRPEFLCVLGLLIGLAALPFFAQGTQHALLIGAIIAYVSNLFDAMDGKLARLKGLASPFGAYLDSIVDVIKHTAFIIALIYGQYQVSEHPDIVLYTGIALVVLFAFKYTNENMLGRIRAFLPVEATTNSPDDKNKAGSTSEQGWFERFDAYCAERSIRPAPCGVEFITLMFIVGPLVNQVMWGLWIGGSLTLMYTAAHTAMTMKRTKFLTRGLQKDLVERDKVQKLLAGSSS